MTTMYVGGQRGDGFREIKKYIINPLQTPHCRLSRRTLEPYEGAAPCNTVAFDHSGSYLAIGGQDARVYVSKKQVRKEIERE